MRVRAGAVVLGVACAAASGLRAQSSWPVVLGLSAAAVAVLTAGLARARPSAIPVAGMLLIAGYALGSAHNADAADPLVPLYGVGLLMMAELAFLSLGVPAAPAADEQLRALYVRAIAGVALASLTAGELLVILAGLVGSGPQALVFLGGFAAAALVATLTRLGGHHARE